MKIKNKPLYPILGPGGKCVDLVPYATYIRLKAQTAEHLLEISLNCSKSKEHFLAEVFYEGALQALEDARKARVNAKRSSGTPRGK